MCQGIHAVGDESAEHRTAPKPKPKRAAKAKHAKAKSFSIAAASARYTRPTHLQVTHDQLMESVLLPSTNTEYDAAAEDNDHDGDRLCGLVHREKNHKWGPFGITIRKGSRCWVARCPFHKKNSATDCKKQSSALGEGEDAARDALLRLYVLGLVSMASLAWCNDALKHDRKWKHGLVDPRALPVLTLAILETQRPDPPHGPAVPDTELD
eukprot:3292748-Amphidinium_carterae.1